MGRQRQGVLRLHGWRCCRVRTDLGYDPGREALTLLFESPGGAVLDGPDNIVVVPFTGDLFICEDAQPPQYVRGLTPGGGIYASDPAEPPLRASTRDATRITQPSTIHRPAHHHSTVG